MSALKRIINKDLKAIKETDLNSQNIFIEFNEDNMFEANAMIIAPEDSIYFGGVLFFKIVFPKNYPFSPPNVQYMACNRVRIHPNLYVGGKVCLSILGTWSGPKWTTVMDITTVLMSIQSLLDNNPLHNEPGQEKNFSPTNDLYNQAIEYESMNSLLFQNMNKPPSGFECFVPTIQSFFLKDNEKIFKKIELNLAKPKRRLYVSFYRIDINVDYEKLKHQFEKNYELLTD